jgi:ribonuclease J
VEIITDNDKNVHVSGHPSRDELIDMYSFIKPKISIPVHGTREHIEAHSILANECQVPVVIKPKNGEFIKLNENSHGVVSKLNFTTHVYDAGEVIPIDDERFVSRRHGLWNGFVSISIVLNKDGDLLISPQITQTGVSNEKNVSTVIADTAIKIEGLIENENTNLDNLDSELSYQISKLVRREFKSSFSKRPIIDIHINRV